MGCCLTKKSRENRIRRDASPLLKDNKPHDQRGLSLNGERSELVHTPSITSQDPSAIDYEPPQTQFNDVKTNKVVIGKSLLESPSVDDLNKCEMIEKRGHLVWLSPSCLSYSLSAFSCPSLSSLLKLS
jgi:hypothetical protein